MQAMEHSGLYLRGKTPPVSPPSSAISSRPASAGNRGSSRPSSASGRGSRPPSASSHKSPGTPALDSRQLKRLKIHQERKQRELRNIFSDPIIEAELGRFAESELKKDRARVFREHIRKVGGRYPKFSFRRDLCSPDLVAPVLSDDPTPRPSFAPLNSSSNILGLEPQSCQHDHAEHEIIELEPLVRTTARPDDIENMILHSSNFTSGIRSRPTSASRFVAQHRPLSAASRVSEIDGPHFTSGFVLSGGSLSGRSVEASGQGESVRATYVTAGAIFS